MVENSQEATIIEVDAKEATETSRSPMNLSLFVAIAALIVSVVALVFVIRGGDNDSISGQQSIFDSIEARLKAVEAAPLADGADLSKLEGELASVRASVHEMEADLATSVSALNSEIERVGEGLLMKQAAAAPAAAPAPASNTATLVDDTLATVSEQIATLSETVDGSLTRLGELSSGLASNQALMTTLAERMETAETVLDTLPTQVSEQITTAVEAAKTASASQIEGLQSSLNDGMLAMADLSSQTEAAFLETRTTFGERLNDVKDTVEERVSTLYATLDETQSNTADQLAVVGETMTDLSDEFTAMKEVSVETSTKVLAVNQLRDALASSAPVRPHMTSLEALNPTEDALLGVLETVDTIADQRVPTQEILVETIAALSPKLVTETRINSAEGTGGKMLARLGSLVTVERIEDIAAIPGIEGNMARAAARVQEADYTAALTELQDDTVEIKLNPETQARFDELLTHLRHRATYEEQRQLLGDWITTTLNATRAVTAN